MPCAFRASNGRQLRTLRWLTFCSVFVSFFSAECNHLEKQLKEQQAQYAQLAQENGQLGLDREDLRHQVEGLSDLYQQAIGEELDLFQQCASARKTRTWTAILGHASSTYKDRDSPVRHTS